MFLELPLSLGAIVLAIGSITGASLPSLITTPYFFDQWWVRLPFILFALLATGINLYLVFNARNIRKKLIYGGAKVQLSPKENRDPGIKIKFTYDFDNYFRFFVKPFCYASSSFFIISTGVFTGLETPGK